MNEALKLITTGKPIKADKAKAVGLIDETASGDLLDAAKSFARNHVIGSELAVYKRPVISPISDEETGKAAKAALSRHQFAKAAAIETVANGAKLPFAESLRHKIPFSVCVRVINPKRCDIYFSRNDPFRKYRP